MDLASSESSHGGRASAEGARAWRVQRKPTASRRFFLRSRTHVIFTRITWNSCKVWEYVSGTSHSFAACVRSNSDKSYSRFCNLLPLGRFWAESRSLRYTRIAAILQTPVSSAALPDSNWKRNLRATYLQIVRLRNSEFQNVGSKYHELRA